MDNDATKWIMDRHSPLRSLISLAANMMLILLVCIILIDYEGFKNSYDCQSYQPIIQAAKQCSNGVRSDLCFTPMTYAYNFTQIGDISGSMVQHTNKTN